MFLKKEKLAFEQLRPVTRASKTKCSIYTSDALWPMSPPITSTKHRTIRYLSDIFSKPSYNDTHIYFIFIYIATTLPPQLLLVRLTNISNALS